MTDNWQEQEARIIDELAKRYRAQGYAIERAPRLEGLATPPDLLATREGDTVLVEVKRARAPREADTRFEDLAEYAGRRGWRFTIVLVGAADGFEEVEVPGREHVLRLLDDARELETSSWIAPIAATAAFEAASRYALVRAGRPAVTRVAPLAYVQALAASGMITPEDEAILRQLVGKRNAAAHGLPTPPVADEIVTQALHIARSLLAPEPAAA